MRDATVCLLILVVGLGCRDLSGLAGKQQLPSGIPDPNTLHTRAGALAAYQGVLAMFQSHASTVTRGNGDVSTGTGAGAFVEFVLNSGLFTDELESGDLGGNVVIDIHKLLLDTRQLTEGVAYPQWTDPLYTELQGMRNSAHLAIAALAAYDTVDSPALRGQMYTLAGYSELFLADLYCSGVPLSTLNADGDFTYQAGSTTQDVYRTAIAQFDTALTLSHDSTRIMLLAQIGIGRAYLALGQYDSAAVAVHDVPTDYIYQLAVDWGEGNGLPGGLFVGLNVADQQGGTGLPYRSSNDPRSASATWGNNKYGVPQYAPVAYGGATLALSAGITPITVANGIEARLIEAEAALKAGNAQWLTILNALRTDGTSTTIPAQTLIDTLGVTQCGGHFGLCDNKANQNTGGSTPAYGQPLGGFPGYAVVSADTVPGADTIVAPGGGNVQDYCYNNSWYIPCYTGDSMVVLTLVKPASALWHAGTGGVSGLAPLTDPGNAADDVALLFQERAYWLFLTGHRQGDLRRLIRNYGLSPDTVYPTGLYPSFGTFSRFGSDVTAPIPTAERANPRFAGCLSRGA
jgi:hypothetical protein